MNITITLTKAEIQGIQNYLNEVDEPTNNANIEREIKTRLYHTLRDSREAISDHIQAAEKKVLNEKP